MDDLYAKLTVAAAVFFVMLEISYLVLAGLPPIDKPWVDGTHFVIGRDFLNTWMGGRSVFGDGPAAWFDLRVYNAALREMLGTDYQEHYWSYPPHVLLFTWPFGLMPYLPAYIAWCLTGIALYLIACSGAIARDRLMFLAVAPGVAVCVFFGQNGFYTAALLIGGLLSRDRRPVLAGALFGILTIKPQIGLLLPVVLLLERRWVTIASALATAAVLVAATAMLFGWDVWIEFWQKVVPQQQWLTANGGGLLLAQAASVFYGARLMCLPAGIAGGMQATVAILAFAALVWTYCKRRDPVLSLALFVTASFLVTPYILNYDMVVFGFVVALMYKRADNMAADHWLLLAVWTLPVTMMILAVGKVPLGPIVLIAFAARLVWRLARGERPERQALPQPVAP
ncbi:MAG TPA: glycosyltransferase family 87 protein [Xanthobacteraceae bacterium]|nr:glycosyltransferase family 87 protein [Xanthobacteraceae bacterium]